MTLPVPPRELWEGYGETPEAYVRSGEPVAYVTIHDEHTLDLLRAMPDHRVTQRVARELGGLPSTFDTFVIDGGTPRDTIVFHSLGFVRAHWGRWFRIAGATPEAYHYQTAVLLEKAVG